MSIGGKDVTERDALVDTIHASLGKTIDVTYDTRRSYAATMHVQPEQCPARRKRSDASDSSPRLGLRARRRAQGVPVQRARISGTSPTRRSRRSAYWSRTSQIRGPSFGRRSAWAKPRRRARFRLGAVLASRRDDLVRARVLQFAAVSRARRRTRRVHRRRTGCAANRSIPKSEALVHIAGFAALMVLMLLVAFHDIARIVSGQGVF